MLKVQWKGGLFDMKPEGLIIVLYCIDLIHDEICDLSRENVHQQFSIERLKPLVTRWLEALMKGLKAMEKWLGVFLYLKKKPLGNFSQTVENVGKRANNQTTPLQKMKLEFHQDKIPAKNISGIIDNQKRL